MAQSNGNLPPNFTDDIPAKSHRCSPTHTSDEDAFVREENFYLHQYLDGPHGLKLLEKNPSLFAMKLMLLQTIDLKSREYRRTNRIIKLSDAIGGLIGGLSCIFVFLVLLGMVFGNIARVQKENGGYCGDNMVIQSFKCIIIPAIIAPGEVPIRAGIKWALDQNFEHN
jgi:hypothetical protein